MNVEIGTEAAQFPEKEYINGIFLAVHHAVLMVMVGWSFGSQNTAAGLLVVPLEVFVDARPEASFAK
jgi:hypothetical protein